MVREQRSLMDSFKTFYEQCNVCANELKRGDPVENINPECDHFKSKGVVLKIKKIPQDEERTAGNIIIYKVSNSSDDFDKKEVNGIFHKGDKLAKTEIQLKKLNEAMSKDPKDWIAGPITQRYAKGTKKYLKNIADIGPIGQAASNFVNQYKYAVAKTTANVLAPVSKKASATRKKIKAGEIGLKYMQAKGKLGDIKPRDLLNPEVQKALPKHVADEAEKDRRHLNPAAFANFFKKKK
jgi:hypothetical protein